MASNNPTFRFLGLLKQPETTTDSTDLDLDEDDVVWSFFPTSNSSYSLSNSNSNSTSPSPTSVHRHSQFDSFQPSLSAALEDNQGHIFNRRSKVIPVTALQEITPVKFRQSAPMKIPIWPKKFSERYNDVVEFDDGGEEQDEGEMVPPHIIVARSHVTFSVFEGVGRTLKGRDLRRVRNAVLQKTGFID